MTSLIDKLPEIITRAGYSELYGLDFTEEITVAHTNVLEKFTRANKGDQVAAAAQLEKTLKWRKQFRPLETIGEPHGNFDQFAVLTTSPSGKVVTWNLYGAARTAAERQQLFGDLDKFLRWRVSVMERGIRLMDFSDADKAYMDQVHDYRGVSFLRLDGATKKASNAVISLFQDYYPEFLSAKYFVNIPLVMTWVFGAVRAFMSQETADKFHVVGNGQELRYVLGEWVPKEYGGNATSLEALAAKEPNDKEAKTDNKESSSQNDTPTAATPEANLKTDPVPAATTVDAPAVIPAAVSVPPN